MIFKQNKRIYVKIFVENQEVDLNTYTDFHLAEICEAIKEHWKTDKDSILFFDVQCYSKCYCFQKPQLYLEIIAYERTNTNPKGRKRIPIPETWIIKKKNERVGIVPPKVVVKRWPPALEALFI